MGIRLVPVDYDPLAESHVTFTPVDYDPNDVAAAAARLRAAGTLPAPDPRDVAAERRAGAVRTRIAAEEEQARFARDTLAAQNRREMQPGEAMLDTVTAQPDYSPSEGEAITRPFGMRSRSTGLGREEGDTALESRGIAPAALHGGTDYEELVRRAPYDHPDTFGEFWGKAAARTWGMGRSALAGVIQWVSEAGATGDLQAISGQPGQQLAGSLLPEYRAGIERAFAEARSRGEVPGQAMFEAAQSDLSRNEFSRNNPEAVRYVGMITDSIGLMAPTIAVSLATRSPAAGAASLGVLSGGEQYAESRAQRRSYAQSSIDGIFNGVAEAVPEMIPLGALMRPGGHFLRDSMTVAGLEGASEVVTQILETGYDMNVLRPDMTWAEAENEVRDAGIVGFFMGAGMHAAAHPFNQIAEARRARAVDAVERDLPQTGIAEQAQISAPNITPEDVASPLPTELIAEGKKAVDEALAGAQADQILDENTGHGVGDRVTWQDRTGTIKDAFTEDDPETGTHHGAVIEWDGGGETRERFSNLRDAGARIHRGLRDTGHRVAPDIVRYLVQHGVREDLAHGIAAGVSAESGNNHGVRNASSGATGLGQWLGERQAELHRRYGPNPTREQQLEFLLWELHGGDRGGPSVLNSRNADEALHNYITRFMRPAAGAETTADLERGRSALRGAGQGGEEEFAEGDAGPTPDFSWIDRPVDQAGAPESVSPIQSVETTNNNVEGDRGPAIGGSRVIDFEQFAAEQGASRQNFGDAGLHSPAGNIGRSTRQEQLRSQLAKDDDLATRRRDLQAEYDAAIERGEIRPPTSLERLQRTAAGHPELETTQAAIRLLEKRAATGDGTRTAPITATTAEPSADEVDEGLPIGDTGWRYTMRDDGDAYVSRGQTSRRVVGPITDEKLVRVVAEINEELARPTPTREPTPLDDFNRNPERALASLPDAQLDAIGKELGAKRGTRSRIAFVERITGNPISTIRDAYASAVQAEGQLQSDNVASPAFDPEEHIEAMRGLIANSNVSLNDMEKVGRRLGLSADEANRVLGALASRPNSGIRMTNGRKAGTRRKLIASAQIVGGKKRAARYKTYTYRPAVPPRFQRLGRRAAPVDLMAWVRDQGGIKSGRHDLRNMGALARHPGIINNKSGKTPDELGEAMVSHGWFDERPTEDEVLQFLTRASTAKVYRPEDGGALGKAGKEEAERTESQAIETLAGEIGYSLNADDVAVAMVYVGEGLPREVALDRAMRDAMAEVLEEGPGDFYALVAESFYEGEGAEQRDHGAGDEGEGDRRPAEAVAGPESVESDAVESGAANAEPTGGAEAPRPVADLLGEPIAEPAPKTKKPAEPGAPDMFGTREGDERRALERAGEGRKQSEATQKAPGSDGGLFDQRDTTRDIEENMRRAPADRIIPDDLRAAQEAYMALSGKQISQTEIQKLAGALKGGMSPDEATASVKAFFDAPIDWEAERAAFAKDTPIAAARASLQQAMAALDAAEGLPEPANDLTAEEFSPPATPALQSLLRDWQHERESGRAPSARWVVRRADDQSIVTWSVKKSDAARRREAQWNPEELELARVLPKNIENAVPVATSNVVPLRPDRSLYQRVMGGDDPIFYSELERTVEASTTTRASAAQWAATLGRAQGIKREELEWSGIFDWLDMQEGPVSRDDLLRVVRDGGIRVEEVVLGGHAEMEWEKAADAVNAAIAANLPEEEIERLRVVRNAARLQSKEPGETQFSAWSSDPSNETYRELLITLPIAEGGNPERAPATHWSSAGAGGMDVAVIAHARFMEKRDAEGKRVLFIEEVQSDWHQKGRDQGYNVADVDLEAVRREYGEAKAGTLAAKEALLDYGAKNDLMGERWFATTIDRLGFDEQARALSDMAAEKGGDDFLALADDLRRAELRRTEATQALRNADTGIPDAPFKSSWPALVMKRLIRLASDQGFEKIAWTTGVEQAERYNLSQTVGQIKVGRSTIPYGDKRTSVRLNHDAARVIIDAGKGQSLNDFSGGALSVAMTDEQVREVFGGDLGGRILASEPGAVLDGEALKIGASAMEQFYDRNLVNITNDIIKKYGGKVEQRQVILAESKGGSRAVGMNPSFDITPKMAAAAQSGFSLFQRGPSVDRRTFIKGATAVAGGFMVGDRLFAQPPGLTSILERSINEAVPLTEPLEWIAANSEDRQFRRFAARMIPLANGIVIRGNPVGRRTHPDGTAVPEDIWAGLAHGMHQVDETTDGDVVWLARGEWVNGFNEGTLIHEALHAALYRIFGRLSVRMAGNDPALLRREGFNREATPRPASEADIAELRGLYQEAVTAFERKVEGMSAEESRSDATRHIRNGIGTPDEFLSYALENRDMQAFLRQQPARSGPTAQTLWDKIVAFIRRVLGLGDTPRTALDDVLDTGYRLLADPQGPAREPNRVIEDSTAAELTRGDTTGRQLFSRGPMPPSEWNEILNRTRDLTGAAKTITSRDKIAEAFDRFRTNFQDRVLPLLRTQTAIERVIGRPLTDEEQPYRQEALYTGRVGDQFEKMADGIVEPLFESMQENKVNVDELESYLYARHAPERNAKLKAEGVDDGSGMTDIEAAAIMARIDKAGKREALEAVAIWFDKLNAFALDTRVDAGLMTPEEAAEWRQRWKYYAPLRGHLEVPEEERPNVGKGFTVRGPESKRAFGRKSQASDILAHAMVQAEEAIVRAEKNRVATELYNLARANPDDNFWKVQKVSMRKRLNKETGLVESYPVTVMLPEDARFTVSLKVNGKAKRVTFNRQNRAAVRAAAAMRRMNEPELNVRAFQIVNQWLSRVNTMLSPDFIWRNAIRDLETATANLSQFDIKGLRRDVLASYPKALAAAERGAFKRGGDTEWDQAWKDYSAEGGRVYYNDVKSVDQLSKEIEARFARIQASNLSPKEAGLKLWEGLKWTFDKIEKVNLGVENAVRLSVFKNLIDRGVSKKQAAFIAKEVTVNFNRRGVYGVLVNSMYLFMNASTQGNMRMIMALKHRRTQKIAGSMIAAGALVAMFNAAMGGDDDDGVPYYDKISDFEKSTNLIFMIPGSRGRYIKIPLAYGYSIFPDLGRQLVDVFRGRTAPLDATSSWLYTALNSFNPIGGQESLGNLIAPTVVDPAVDIYVDNRDYADRPIMPDQSPYGPRVPDSQRFWPSVPPYFRALTDALNRGTGGDQVQPGWIDISPETLDYMAQAATGSAGATITRIGGAIGKLVDRDPETNVELNDIPVLRTMIGAKPSWYDRAAFYARLRSVEDTVAQDREYIHLGDREGQRRFVADNRDILELHGAATQARREMQNIRRARAQADIALEHGRITRERHDEIRATAHAREERLFARWNRVYLQHVADPIQPQR